MMKVVCGYALISLIESSIGLNVGGRWATSQVPNHQARHRSGAGALVQRDAIETAKDIIEQRSGNHAVKTAPLRSTNSLIPTIAWVPKLRVKVETDHFYIDRRGCRPAHCRIAIESVGLFGMNPPLKGPDRVYGRSSTLR